MRTLFFSLFCLLATTTAYSQTDYPVYSIATVTAENADGVADSLNITTELRGVVYIVNLRITGLQFTLIDFDNNGIGVFNSTKNYGYTVMQGDSILVRGKIEQFNGLTQINPDKIIRISQNNESIEPILVDSLGEFTESQLIQLSDFFRLVNPAQWTNTGTGFDVDITNGVDTFQVRIDADTDILEHKYPQVHLFYEA